MAANQPRGREKHVTDNSKGVKKRGDGLGTGPVGAGHGPGSSGGRQGGGGGQRSGSSGGKSPLAIIIALVVVLLGGGGGAMSMLGGDDDSSYTTTTQQTTTTQTTQQTTDNTASSTGSSSNKPSGYSSSQYESLYSALINGQGTGSSWSQEESTGTLDTTVAAGARAKYTTIKGNGKDTTTIMIYMCGTDLESKSGMATSDMQEMAKATLGSNINLIIYTGGCSNWKISGISTKTNQIYQIKDGKLKQLEADMGAKSMVSPSTLTEFIKYCKKNFPADRNDLILWDHGGGSISGYGYDEKYKNSGAMDLSNIDKALTDAGVKFDFIGFDACLMATAENALMLNDHADYLIASEETEPGIGWYYTDWLTAYGKNPSMDTLSIGKKIVDGFVDECAVKCRGQLTTLSVIDLAEFAATVPDALSAFSADTTQMIKNDQYSQIASARQSTREFAQSSRIDQCDLVDLANRLNTSASKELAKVIQNAVKYNRTSSNMTNAYGVSIYFPNKKLAYVSTAVSLNNSIGILSDYSSCIKEYASLSTAGQNVSYGVGNTQNPYGSLFGNYYSSGSSSYGSSSGSASSSSSYSSSSYGSSSYGTADSDLVYQLLESLLGGGTSSYSSSGGSYFGGRSLTDEETVDYIAANQLDASLLYWVETEEGEVALALTEDQWQYVTGLDQNMFFDDGEGYIDLGCDNLFTFDDNGNMIADLDHTWLAIDGQPVAYYHLTTVDDGENYSINGYVPAMLNGERIVLYLTFDQDQPYGYIAGYSTDYQQGETETIAKANNELQEGDVLEFLCDYYTYDGEYQDSYYLGEPMTVTEDLEISNVPIDDDAVLITYKITDIYGAEYWTQAIR